eukprot:TRINITY_DN30585_c0_g1_i1.p1 TRINITY_DN30585_c0_g1~~TRINITY_DN30585_c0_g1_i1.p1  ORF type:complete len:393 (-),score=51.40 TRINITY_DN30585_c0_g1_i1:202-1380(-)
MARELSPHLASLAVRGRDADLVAELVRSWHEGGDLVVKGELDALSIRQKEGQLSAKEFADELSRVVSTAGDRNIEDVLHLVSLYAKAGEKQRSALKDSYVIEYIAAWMLTQKDDCHALLVALRTVATVVGPQMERWGTFVLKHKGLTQIEDAMQRYPENASLQVIAIRLLSGTVRWAKKSSGSGLSVEEVFQKANFCPQRAIALTKQAMLLHPIDSELLVEGINAMAEFVGQSNDHLIAFASGRGLEIIVQTMLRHPENARLQESCIRVLSAGTQWSSEVCKQTGFCAETAISLIKQAMLFHLDDVTLLLTAIERIADRFCMQNMHTEAIARYEGADLFRTIIDCHDNGALRCYCKKVLTAIGAQCPDLTAISKVKTKGVGFVDLELGNVRN